MKPDHLMTVIPIIHILIDFPLTFRVQLERGPGYKVRIIDLITRFISVCTPNHLHMEVEYFVLSFHVKDEHRESETRESCTDSNNEDKIELIIEDDLIGRRLAVV
uniref:Uncharacterized protein n=1 Tax=Cacopsylla melanoneura TaxID=428564 RepID=A0A8D9E6G2_9HEMI